MKEAKATRVAKEANAAMGGGPNAAVFYDALPYPSDEDEDEDGYYFDSYTYGYGGSFLPSGDGAYTRGFDSCLGVSERRGCCGGGVDDLGCVLS